MHYGTGEMAAGCTHETMANLHLWILEQMIDITSREWPKPNSSSWKSKAILKPAAPLLSHCCTKCRSCWQSWTYSWSFHVAHCSLLSFPFSCCLQWKNHRNWKHWTIQYVLLCYIQVHLRESELYDFCCSNRLTRLSVIWRRAQKYFRNRLSLSK